MFVLSVAAVNEMEAMSSVSDVLQVAIRIIPDVIPHIPEDYPRKIVLLWTVCQRLFVSLSGQTIQDHQAMQR